MTLEKRDIYNTCIICHSHIIPIYLTFLQPSQMSHTSSAYCKAKSQKLLKPTFDLDYKEIKKKQKNLQGCNNHN